MRQLDPDFVCVETRMMDIAKVIRWFEAKHFKYIQNITYVDLLEEGMFWKIKPLMQESKTSPFRNAKRTALLF